MINIDVPLNFNAITNRLLVGSRPQTLSDIERLRMASVSHIIDVCEVDDALLLNGADWISMGIEGYLWNTAFDNGLPKPASWFLTSLHFAMPLMTVSGPVIYVHCYDGIDRGPSTAYAILRAMGLTQVQARLLLNIARPIALARYTGDTDQAINGGW